MACEKNPVDSGLGHTICSCDSVRGQDRSSRSRGCLHELGRPGGSRSKHLANRGKRSDKQPLAEKLFNWAALQKAELEGPLGIEILRCRPTDPLSRLEPSRQLLLSARRPKAVGLRKLRWGTPTDSGPPTKLAPCLFASDGRGLNFFPSPSLPRFIPPSFSALPFSSSPHLSQNLVVFFLSQRQAQEEVLCSHCYPASHP